MFCSNCGKEIDNKTIMCIHCGCAINNNNFVKKELPQELQCFNWGAFLFTWIWGLGNNSYIALLSLINIFFYLNPFAGWLSSLGFSIWLGCKGNEFAWKNGQWKDIEHFNKVQRNWATWGLIIIVPLLLLKIFLISLVLAFIAGFVEALVE